MGDKQATDNSKPFLVQWLETLGLPVPDNRQLSADHAAEIVQKSDVAPDAAARAFAKIWGLPFVQSIDPSSTFDQFTQKYPISLARRVDCLLIKEGEDLHLIVAGPIGWQQQDVITRLFRRDIGVVVATPAVIQAAIDLAYSRRDSQTHQAIESLDVESDVLRIGDSTRQDLLDQTGNTPVIMLVNSILFDAVKQRASDVHIQPYEQKLQVRFRIDGVLFDQFEIPKQSQNEVLSRIKIIGKMNIAEKRLPQDGRATAEIGQRLIDLRIASLPTSHGERIVIRLLDKSAQLYTLNELGMPKDTLRRFRDLIRLEHGLILVTGPTGGGKSTTLYASLLELDVNQSNVVTLEDPIEYQLDGISQTQVNAKKGMTFASGLRNVLRQDPDIIMIGEIRDRETAEMSIQSALTGHMVYSTLHTNDAASAVTRLLDLGIEPFLVASSVIGVMSQRLIRRLCDQCKSAVGDTENACMHCRGTGYFGRVGVFELLTIDEGIRELITSRGNAAQIRKRACESGMRLLQDDAQLKVDSGLTTESEVMRISMQLSSD